MGFKEFIKPSWLKIIVFLIIIVFAFFTAEACFSLNIGNPGAPDPPGYCVAWFVGYPLIFVAIFSALSGIGFVFTGIIGIVYAYVLALIVAWIIGLIRGKVSRKSVKTKK
jgi:hypothetical protein